MTEPINPYASPETPPEQQKAVPSEMLRVLRAGFMMDVKLQRDLARNTVRRWQHRRIAVAILPIALLTLVTMCIAAVQSANENTPTLVMVVGLLFAGLLCWLLQGRFTQPNINVLREHPILGATGYWDITLAEHSLSIRTTAGEQIWPLESIWIQTPTKDLMLFWLEPDLPLAIPLQSDFGEVAPTTFRNEIFQRIGRYQP